MGVGGGINAGNRPLFIFRNFDLSFFNSPA